MDIAELNKQNPWWSSDNWAEHDYHLQRMRRNKYIYEREDYLPEKEGVFVVYGPRQVGKTTWLKQRIKKLAADRKTTDLFYLNVEVVRDRFELHETVSKVLDLYRPCHIFLDEVGALQDWEKAVKVLVDEGRLENREVLLTGSSSINIMKKAERLPGRVGPRQYKFRYYPLSFREVIKVYGLKVGSPLEAMAKLNELNGVLFRYFLHGGFIPAINHFAQNNSLSEEMFSLYSGWIDGELAREKRSSETATYVMDNVVNALTNEANWNSLVKGVSQPTVASYIELLEEMFVLSYIEKSARALEGVPRNKKIYFIDPFLYWVACFRAHRVNLVDESALDNATLGKLAEQALFANLLQHTDQATNENEFNVRKHITFEKDRQGEIDFSVRAGKSQVLLESKFGTGEVKPKGREILLTRTELSGRALPLAVFLLFPKESGGLLKNG